MNKIIYFLILTFISLIGCMNIFDDNEYHPEFFNYLYVVDTDLDDYHEILEVDYDNNNHDLLKVINFIVNPQQTSFILNGGSKGIWQLDIDGSDSRKLTDTLWVRKTEIAISHFGTMILFSSRGDIYRVNINGSNLVRLTNTPDDYEDHPDFYPDDLKIVYTKIVSYEDSSKYYSICRMDINGNNQEEIISSGTKDDYYYTYPLVLPGADKILYNKFGENPGICSYDVNTQEENKIFSGSYLPNKRISMTEDGSKIVAINYSVPYIIDPDGNVLYNIQEITGDYYFRAKISPEGNYLTLECYDELYKFDFSDSTVHLIDTGTLPYCFTDRIYYIWRM